MNFILVIFLKILSKILTLFGKKGGNVLGNIAYKINPSILKYFKIDGTIIATTATNGKTMTNNIITSLFENAGYSVVSNKEGNNMLTGIISTLIKSCSLNGKVKADYLCFEVDESYVPIIFSELKLSCLVVGNFFRDQLDRNGEVEHLIQNIEKFLKTYSGKVVLNGNDPNVLRLGKYIANKDNIYVVCADAYANATKQLKDAGEGKYCPFCKTKLDYEFYQYSHIGKFECPNCHFGNVKPYTSIKNINLQNKSFQIGDKTYDIAFDNIYTIYNFGLAYTVAKLYNLPDEDIYNTFKNFKLNNGRMEELHFNNTKTVINLAKNPSGANVSMRLLSQDSKDKELLFVLNDNVADGKDVSWIYDIDFDSVTSNPNVKRIVLSGTRPYDIAIRIKNSFYPKELIEVFENLDKAVESLYSNTTDKYVITNYTSLQPTRKAIFKFKEMIEKE